MSSPANPTPRQVTQAQHPWRTTVRSAVQFGLGAAAAAPLIYQAATQDSPEGATGAAAIGLAIAGGVTRVMALPQVEALLRSTRGLRWLAAARD